MKILRTHIGRLFLLAVLLSMSVDMTGQTFDDPPVTPSVPCAQPDCQDAIYIGNDNTPTTTVVSDTYSSQNILHSDGTVNSTSTVDYKSNYVRLDIGFSTEVGADFSAEIEACVNDNTGGVSSESSNLECLDYVYVGNDNTPGATISSNLYQAGQALESDGTVDVQAIVRQKAGHQVTLKPGFKALKGSVFRGYIEPCSEGASTGTYYINDASQIGDIYTSAPGSNSTGNGTPSKPFATLKHVIQTQVLTGGDIIYIDTGIYDDTFVEINNPINNLTIKGAGVYNTIFDNNYTDNDIEDNTLSTGNLFMRIYTNGILLEGFTVREYNYLDMDGNAKGLDGKAISVKGAECVVFDNIHITENAAGSNNGFSLSSILIRGACSVDILNSSVSYNQSSVNGVEGGGIDIYESPDGGTANLNIINSLISNNIRNDRSGGGIQITGKHSVYIDNSTISNNVALLYGGGINMASFANLNINNSCLSNNIAITDDKLAEGGGIRVKNGAALNIYNTVFNTNAAQGTHGVGGAIYSNTTIKTEQCKFENNQAAGGNHILAGTRLDIDETQFSPEANAIYLLNQTDVYIQNSGTPETSSPITFINNTPPQNYATPSCNSQADCIADAGFDQTLCPGESIQIGTAPQDGLTYYWEPTTGLNNNTISNPTANPSETTTYTLHVGGCGGRGFEDEVTVYVSEGDITFPPNQVTCGSTDILLTVNGGVEYLWTPAGGLSCIDCPNPTANVTETTTYTVTVTDDNGCEITRDITITVAGNLAISVSAEPEGIICPGESVQLNATGAVNYIWSPADGGLSNPTISNPTVSPSETTTYTVTGFQDECQAVGEITIDVAPEYDITFISVPSVCAIDVMASDDAMVSYEWSVDGEIIPEATNMYISSLPVTHNGTYQVCLTVIGGCQEEVTVCENVIIDGCICLDADIFDCPDAMANVGHPCDDDNDATVGDVYNEDCECEGVDCSLVELLDVDEQLPSAINYGELHYDGSAVSDYIIQWQDENGDVAFTSATGSYYNSNIHESHPPMSNIPLAAGTYTPVVVASNPLGLMYCTLPTYTVNDYECTGTYDFVHYTGPPGVTRETTINWPISDSSCGLSLSFQDYDLPDNLEVIGIDAAGIENPLLQINGGNYFQDIVVIQGNYESVILRVTSDPGDGDNTRWYVGFSCCTDVCCTATYTIDVIDNELNECGNCKITVPDITVNPDGCPITGIADIEFNDDPICVTPTSGIPCDDLSAMSTLTLTTGQAEFSFMNDSDYQNLETRFKALGEVGSTADSEGFSDYRFELQDQVCGSDGGIYYYYISHLNGISYDPIGRKITVTYDVDYESCSDCVQYDNYDNIIRNISSGTTAIHNFISIDWTVRYRLTSPNTNYSPFRRTYYYTSTGCDGQLNPRKLSLEIQDQNCPCESWILMEDITDDGVSNYDFEVEEADGWNGVCSQP